MSRFNVDTDGLRSAAGRCDGISSNIYNLGNQIRDVKNSLNGDMGRYGSVLSALDACISNARRCSSKVDTFGNYGVWIANHYQQTEDGITGNIKLDKFGNVIPNIPNIPNIPWWLGSLKRSNLADALAHLIGPCQFLPFISSGPISALSFLIDALYGKPNGASGTGATFKNKLYKGTTYKWDSEKKKWVEQKRKDGKPNGKLAKDYSFKREYDSKNKKWVEPEEVERKGWGKVEKQVKLQEWKADAPSAEVWGTSGKLEGDYGKLEGSVDVLKAETHADAYVGLMSAGGTIGASATAFTATGLAQLGNDNLGGYVTGTVTAGKVGAQAEGSIGIYDKYGNFKPNVKVGASAEAIAGEISGKAGVKVAGTDIGVSGSLNYGIGAHANVGFEGGKFQVDIGATLGVGASVKLEVDVSGTVNAIAGAAKSALSKFKFW